MRKCEFCGAEGCAPKVRGAKSAAVSLGNYRMSAPVDVELCDACADAVMGELLGKLLGRLAEGRKE